MRRKTRAGGSAAVRSFCKEHIQKGLILLLILCTLTMWLRINDRIRPAAEQLCTYECRSIAQAAISDGVERTLSAMDELEPTLICTVYSHDGDVSTIQTNSGILNMVQLLLKQNIESSLREQKNAEFAVSLGTVSGMPALTGRGPSVPLRFCPAGTVEIDLNSSFSSAGINQTLYRLTADIHVEAGCSIPLYHARTEETFTYLLAEILIHGDAPDSGRFDSQ